MSESKAPEEAATAFSKKFVYCLELARETFAVAVLQTEALAPVASAFEKNVKSVCQMMVLPTAVADMAYEFQRNLDFAEVDLTGALSVPMPPDREAEILGQASHVVRRRIERDLMMPDAEWRELIYERLKWGAAPLGWLPATRHGSLGLDALFSSFVVGSWTAVETMIGDLWVTTLNTHPDGLVSLQGNPNRYKNSAHSDKKAEDISADRDSNKRKNAAEVSFSHTELVALQLDIKDKMGTMLAEKRYNFSKLENARLAYFEAFWKDSEKIGAAITDKSLDKLHRLRNVMVHRAGVADQTYLKGAKSLGLPLASVGSEIPLDGESVVNLVRPAFQAGFNLLYAVDAWLVARKAALSRRTTEGDSP
jgi:hypothetical protein